MKMKRVIVGTALGLPVLLLAGAAFIVVSSYVEHRQLVEQEKEAYPAPGTLVAAGTNGGALHVFAEGPTGTPSSNTGTPAGATGSAAQGNARSADSNPTLVFLSGLGTSSPYYDFKVLFEQFSPEYRVAVVERAGYGWSDITSSPRDLATVLQETRTALQGAGETPPYVLFPHSLAGLEALYWAHHYPEELHAVIGLDPLVPEYHQQSSNRASLSRGVTLLARTGLMRSGPDIFASNFPAMLKGHLTQEDAQIAETIFLRRTHTRNMWAEVAALPENSQLVLDQGLPSLPFHVFISDHRGDVWKSSLIEFAEASNSEYYLLDAEHYIHLDKPEFIAETSRKLIESAGPN